MILRMGMMDRRRRREGVRLRTTTNLTNLMKKMEKRGWGIWRTKGAKKKTKSRKKRTKTKRFHQYEMRRFLQPAMTLPLRSYLMSSDSLSDIS